MSFRDTDWKGLDKGKAVSYILSKIKRLLYSIADVILKLLAWVHHNNYRTLSSKKELHLHHTKLLLHHSHNALGQQVKMWQREIEDNKPQSYDRARDRRLSQHSLQTVHVSLSLHW